VGALETKKLSLFSEQELAQCELLTDAYSEHDSQLEAALFPSEDGGTRFKAIPAEMLSKQTSQVSKLAGTLKDELFSFLLKHGGDWGDNQVPKELEPLILAGKGM
jgi:hypothetical protein